MLQTRVSRGGRVGAYEPTPATPSPPLSRGGGNPRPFDHALLECTGSSPLTRSPAQSVHPESRRCLIGAIGGRARPWAQMYASPLSPRRAQDRLPWALRYTPPKAAGHSGQTDCVSPKRRGSGRTGCVLRGQRVRCPKAAGRSGRTGCVAPIRWGYSRPTADAHPSVNLDPTPATSRPSSFPRRRESITVVVRHALLECTSSPRDPSPAQSVHPE